MPRPRGPNYKESKHPRAKTDYVGVYSIEVTSRATGKVSKNFYITYYRRGERHYEKAVDKEIPAKTAAQANKIRAAKMEGRELPNVEKREKKKAAKEAEAGRWTIDKIWTEYNVQRRKGKADPTDKSNFTLHISPTFGAKEPAALVPLDVDRLRVKMQKTLAPGTVAKVLGLLRRLINFAAKKQLSAAPAFKVELPRVDNLKTEDLNPEQLTRLLKVLRSERLDDDPPDADISINPDARDIVRMALYTGMRRGEIFKLTWDDVDFRRGFISIRNPKGGADATIPLSGPAREVLEGRPRTEDCPYIFPGRFGGKRTDVKRAVDKIRKRAKLPAGFRPLHGLRHHFASALASSGEVDLYTLQRLLTHKSPLMTQRYAHLRDDTLKNAAELAGRLMGNVTEKTAEKESETA